MLPDTIIGKATSYSEDDKYGRVTVSSTGIWEDNSPLIQQVNNQSIAVGDLLIIRLLDHSLSKPVIEGKYRCEEQVDSEPEGDGTLVHLNKYNDDWVMVRTSKGESLDIRLSDGNQVKISQDKIEAISGDSKVIMEGKEISIESTTKVTVKAQRVAIDGIISNSTTIAPSVGGPFCGLPNCLFTGAVHTGKTGS